MIRSIKTVALFGAVVLGLAFTSGSAKAQETVNANITTSSAITTTDGVDMGFGTWFAAVVSGDAFTIGMLSSTGAVTAAGVTTSFAIELVPVDQAGTVTVEMPTGADNVLLQMTATAITDFADPGLSLSALNYTTATEGNDVVLVPLTPVDVTAVTGGTPETVRFGGTIDVSATPADAAHVASFDVSFAF